jgi:hypothetical protein
MRTLLIIALCLWGLAGPLGAAEEIQHSVSILDNGTIALPNNGEVPPYSKSGKWTEMEKKESDRYVIRHFLFMVPNKPPALELYVKHDRANEPPDGVFEIGLVRGYVSGFASKAGFTSGGLVFEDVAIGSDKVKRCLVPLSKDKRKIWVYAYIYPRKPSLTFLTVRAEPDARDGIENYLTALRLR